ncbi:MAG TPA: histidinol dehydrogenase [Burkholderiales bacterium]|nr:histidinol dehydrogenase [Burkholderiales bacterium]
MKMRRLSTADAGFEASLQRLTHFDAAEDVKVAEVVRVIIADVRARRDAAVLEYARRFDGTSASSVADLAVSADEARAALAALPGEQRRALESAHERIRAFHERQLQKSWDYREADGTRLGQRVGALDRVGLYVPGGKAAYPSSVLMNAVPARVAGVREIVMVSPNPSPMVLAAAAIAGVDGLLTLGGAHAIAALAHGTESVPRVDKIVGPGNVYVAEAKRQVFGRVGIDMIAGPSEILVISDGSAPADWIAMDLFAQAEHDEAAQALLLSPSREHLDAVEAATGRLLPELARREVIAASLNARGALIQTRDLDEACAIADRIAPEHLELCVQDAQAALARLHNAGAIFLGQYSSEALGDYCAGPNHVLPTSGSARFASPLGVYDFQKRTSVIEVSRAGAQKLGPIAAMLAEGEGLGAHARSAQMRLDK